MKPHETVSSMTRTVGTALRHPLGFMRQKRLAPGARPGIAHLPEASAPPDEGHVTISCLDYGPDLHEAFEVEDLDGFLERERPKGGTVRWIHVAGLHAYTIQQLQRVYPFHSLVAEDVLHAAPRPKVEPYENHIFLVAQMLLEVDGKPSVEQVSLVLFDGVLITFLRRPGDVWDHVRARISMPGSRMGANGADFLLYALVDAIVDNFFPVLERYGDTLDDIEAGVLKNPRRDELHRLYSVKQELILLRRVIWPTRQLVDDLYRTERREIGAQARTYLRDVYDHAFQVMDIVEAFRETAGSLTDLYMSSVANRMNEVMKVLTVMASVFIPITFLAGVYGMNFEHIPELSWRWAYGVFWAACGITTVGLLMYFRHRGWIGPATRDS